MKNDLLNDLLFVLIVNIQSFALGCFVGLGANHVHPCMIRAEYRSADGAEYRSADGPDEAYCKAWDELEKQGKR